MVRLITFCLLCFFVASSCKATVLPDGYVTLAESGDAILARKLNGQAIYIEWNNPEHRVFIEATILDVVYWFNDGSYIQIDIINNRITQVGQLHPRTGDRKRDSYHVSLLGREPFWDITASNRMLFERFSRLSSAIQESTDLSATAITSPIIQNQLKVDDESTTFFTQSVPHCEAERDNALYGYLGRKTLSACYSTEDVAAIVTAVGMAFGCLSPAGVTVATCIGSIGLHTISISNKESKTQDCKRAKQVADRDLRICEGANNDSGSGGSGGQDSGTGNSGSGTSTPILRCIEWITLKNTTIGDVLYCSGWSIQ